MSVPRGPVLIDLDGEDATGAPGPDTVPPVPEESGLPVDGAAAQRLAGMATRRRNRLAAWFWGLLGALVLSFAGIALWSGLSSLMARNPALALVGTGLLAAFGLVCLLIVLRELAAFGRLSRIDALQRAAVRARADGDLTAARDTARRVGAFYGKRPELRRQADRLADRIDGAFDADAALALAETEMLAPLDAMAAARVEAAARQVATVTALVPLALADVVAALTANLRMIRGIAEVYGGRSGTFGTWRLMRAVLAHLVATGAVAVGDDMVQSILGGSMLSRISRRFGEGVVNGALTARVGVAAMEVCRPLPFSPGRRPSVSGLVKRALAGLFGQGGSARD